MQVHRFPTLCCDYQVARVKALLKRYILLYIITYLDCYMHKDCIENYRPLVMDATQSRLKGLLMKAKRYIIPFDKRKLAYV